MHGVLLTYGTYIHTAILLGEIYSRELTTKTYTNNAGEVVHFSWSILTHWLLTRFPIIFALNLLCLLLGLVMIAFWGMHMWQVIQNKTTNETFKWSDVREYVSDQLEALEYVEKHPPPAYDAVVEGADTSNGGGEEGGGGGGRGKQGSSSSTMTQRIIKASSGDGEEKQEEEGGKQPHSKREQEEQEDYKSRHPVTSRTTGTSGAQKRKEATKAATLAHNKELLKSMLVNKYDKGMKGNLMECFFPDVLPSDSAANATTASNPDASEVSSSKGKSLKSNSKKRK